MINSSPYFFVLLYQKVPGKKKKEKKRRRKKKRQKIKSKIKESATTGETGLLGTTPSYLAPFIACH